MHFDIYHVLIGLLIFFTFLYSDLALSHRLVFEKDAGNFFKPYSVFVFYS